MPRKVPARGIEVRWPEEGDRQGGGAVGVRARAPLGSGRKVRRKRELTSGSHIHPDKYLGDAWRTVRRPLETVRETGVTILPPKRNLAPRFKEWLKGEL